MLEKLDTLIAFAVVMLGLSLIITILTQIVSSVLGLRGSNLLWGIETLFKELAPHLPDGEPKSLAKEILQHQLISDSSFSRLGEMWLVGPLVNWLSTKPLTGWIIDRWRYATAIRSEELVRMLHGKIGLLPPGDAVRTELTNLLNAADAEAIRSMQILNSALPNLVPTLPEPASPPSDAPHIAYSVQMDKLFQQVTTAAGSAVGRLESWFSSTMDRVTQRFASQLRIWTVVFAFVLAFGVHIDSLRLLEQLSANSDTRNALVGIRDGMLSQARTILPPAGAAASPEVPVSSAILTEALDRLKKSNTALANVGDIPADVATVKDAETWLTGQPGVSADAVAEYRRTVIAVLRDHADTINKDLQKAGFQIIPSPWPGIGFTSKRDFLGVLLAAAFLSLGAPFWYNALKNLSNLKTVVASKEQQESSAS